MLGQYDISRGWYIRMRLKSGTVLRVFQHPMHPNEQNDASSTASGAPTGAVATASAVGARLCNGLILQRARIDRLLLLARHLLLLAFLYQISCSQVMVARALYPQNIKVVTEKKAFEHIHSANTFTRFFTKCLSNLEPTRTVGLHLPNDE